MSQVGVITGLASEIDCLRGIVDPAGGHVRCAGADGGRAGRLARELAGKGCSALLSFGLAGGLDPRLPAGHVVIAEQIVADGRTLRADASWSGRCRTILAGRMAAGTGTLLGVGDAVTTADEKRRLHAATGAAALDMESAAVAAVADEFGVPFLAIRVIADSAAQSVPAWLPSVIDENGAVRVAAFAGRLLTHPADGPDIFRLAGVNRRAMAALRRVAVLLGPGLGFL